jgi:predicted lipase
MYNSKQALQFSKFSYKSFSTDIKCLSEAQKIDADIERAFFKSTNSDAQFYTLYKSSGDIVFVFRGSSSLQDFLVDARFFKTSAPDLGKGVAIHGGFYTQYLEIIFDVMASIFSRVRKTDALYHEENNNNTHEEKIPQVNISFIGHSLGGAIASLCALAAKKVLGSKICVFCYTFGSPRVGNNEFSKAFNHLVDNSERYVNECDVVTMNPRILYYHVKGEIQLKNRKETWLDYFGNVKDHYLESYEKNLHF